MKSDTEYLPIIIKYILSTGNLAEEKIKEAAKGVPGGENVVETTADRLRQEGRLEGLNEGRNEGLKEGITIGESRALQVMLIEVLQDNFGILPPVLMDKIKSINFTETLTFLFRQALKVESIQEFNRIIDRLS